VVFEIETSHPPTRRSRPSASSFGTRKCST